jgi:hypothetical protein
VPANPNSPKVQIVAAAGQVRHGPASQLDHSTHCYSGSRVCIVPSAATPCTLSRCQPHLTHRCYPVQGPELALWAVKQFIPTLADVKGQSVGVDAPNSGLVLTVCCTLDFWQMRCR